MVPDTIATAAQRIAHAVRTVAGGSRSVAKHSINLPRPVAVLPKTLTNGVIRQTKASPSLSALNRNFVTEPTVIGQSFSALNSNFVKTNKPIATEPNKVSQTPSTLKPNFHKINAPIVGGKVKQAETLLELLKIERENARRNDQIDRIRNSNAGTPKQRESVINLSIFMNLLTLAYITDAICGKLEKGNSLKSLHDIISKIDNDDDPPHDTTSLLKTMKIAAKILSIKKASLYKRAIFAAKSVFEFFNTGSKYFDQKLQECDIKDLERMLQDYDNMLKLLKLKKVDITGCAIQMSAFETDFNKYYEMSEGDLIDLMNKN